MFKLRKRTASRGKTSTHPKYRYSEKRLHRSSGCLLLSCCTPDALLRLKSRGEREKTKQDDGMYSDSIDVPDLLATGSGFVRVKPISTGTIDSAGVPVG